MDEEDIWVVAGSFRQPALSSARAFVLAAHPVIGIIKCLLLNAPELRREYSRLLKIAGA